MKISERTPDDIRVSHIMTRDVKVIEASETVRSAAMAMATHDLRTLVVVDDKSVIGIISDEDIVRMLVAKNRPASTPVGELMSVDLVTAGPDTTIADAASMMTEHNISTIPVIDNGSLAGIVTKTDIIRIYPTMIEHFKSNTSGPAAPNQPRTTDHNSHGTCELCGNQSNDLAQDNAGAWVCESCRG